MEARPMPSPTMQAVISFLGSKMSSNLPTNGEQKATASAATVNDREICSRFHPNSCCIGFTINVKLYTNTAAKPTSTQMWQASTMRQPG